MSKLFSITIKTLIFFIVPGVAMLLFTPEQWDDPMFLLLFQGAKITGGLFLVIGVVFFFVQLHRSKRKQLENKAQEKVKMMNDKSVPLAYEKTEPLTAADYRFISKQLRNMVIVLIPIACIPLVLLLVVEEDSRPIVYMATVFWAVMVAGVGSQAYSNFTRIRDSGEKTVVKGIITERFKKYETSVERHSKESSTTVLHHFRIGDIELRVTVSMYQQYHVGDAVEFHYAPMYFFGKRQHNTFFIKRKLEGAGIVQG